MDSEVTIKSLARMIADGFANTATSVDMQGVKADMQEVKQRLERVEDKLDRPYIRGLMI